MEIDEITKIRAIGGCGRGAKITDNSKSREEAKRTYSAIEEVYVRHCRNWSRLR